MFKKETEYALRGLVYIMVQNLKGSKPGVVEIAHEIEAPHFYTAKILQRLVRQGLVNSTKGKGGGFYFDECNSKSKLKDVINATEGNRLFKGCGFGLKQCDEKNPCPLHNRFMHIRGEINRLVNEETIYSLSEKIIQGKASVRNVVPSQI